MRKDGMGGARLCMGGGRPKTRDMGFPSSFLLLLGTPDPTTLHRTPKTFFSFYFYLAKASVYAHLVVTFLIIPFSTNFFSSYVFCLTFLFFVPSKAMSCHFTTHFTDEGRNRNGPSFSVGIEEMTECLPHVRYTCVVLGNLALT